jgi:hypothetical protein
MANFSIDPAPFIPPALQVEDGDPQRVARSFINLSGNVLHAHEKFVIAVDTFQVLDQEDIHPFMHQVGEYITGVMHLLVRSVCRHPFAIDLYQLDTTFHKDLLLEGNPHEIDGIDVTFINHDQALNRRAMNYSRYGWIMMLGYPLDYRSLEFIDQTVSSFGKLITWHNNCRSLGYVLVKCLYNGAQSMPRSLVFRQGESWTWTVLVYVLNWEGLGEHHPEVEDVPPDGNPHPMPQEPLGPDLHQSEGIADQIMDNVQELPAQEPEEN